MRAITLAAIAACTASPILPPVRFANAPPVTAVNDRLDVREPPSDRLFLPLVYHYDGTIQRRLTRALELPRDRRALGVNALDEVPDSTWFTNRIGTRDLTPDEVFRGPLTGDGPELHRPWTVRSTKVGGATLGLIIKDARGVKYLLKFDTRGGHELETGAHVVVNRLLWAAGYNVPEDEIVYFKPEELVIAPDAKIKRPDGSEQGKLDRSALDGDLAGVVREPDGRIRAMASRWIEGTTVGGHPAEGVREDDPNDLIPHELRRDLRGARPLFAWFDDVDVQEGNYLDAWVADPANPKRHYVRHYMIDFGMSLGAMGWFMADWHRSFIYDFDIPDILFNLVTLGLADSPWRHRPLVTPIRGLFDAESFDPGNWHPDSPAYVPFLTADKYDSFWGTKILARFSRADIRAAVDAGHFTEPGAADYIVDTLVARQHKTMDYWFARVSPLDRFVLDAGILCFDDLAPAANTDYTIEAYDNDVHAFGAARAATGGNTRVCVGDVPIASDANGYTILRVIRHRPDATGETDVHVARDPVTGTPRVIGIWRP